MDGTMLAERLQEQVAGVCLIAGSLLMAASTFLEFAEGTRFAAGFVGVLAYLCFIPALLGIARLLRERAPRLSVVGTLVAICGCGGGVAFEAAILHEWAARAAGLPEAQVAALLEIVKGRVFPALLIFGIQFSLSLLVLGVGLVKTAVVPKWVPALIVCGALLFPLGHIGRIEPIMHLADFLLVVPMIWLGLRALSGATPQGRAVPATT